MPSGSGQSAVTLQAAWSPSQLRALAVPQLHTLSSRGQLCRGVKGDVWGQKVQERPCTELQMKQPWL